MTANQKLGSRGTPSAELEINTDLVAELLQEQHPDLSHLPIEFLAAGWDNAIFRLGEELAVRLPRRQLGATIIEHEQTWLPAIAKSLTIAVPTPYRIGKPSKNYPWRWSVLPWLPGVAATQEPPNINQAEKFATFLRSLHLPAPSNAPANPLRGVPLTQRAVVVEQRLPRLESRLARSLARRAFPCAFGRRGVSSLTLDAGSLVKTNLITPKLKQIWQQALNAPIDVQPRWLHGDLHPDNILVQDGVIVGVIDWGDITSGDIATDLAAIWMLFPEQDARQRAIAGYSNISLCTLQRAKGWAIFFGVTLLETGLVDNPQYAAIGEQTLCRVIEDE